MNPVDKDSISLSGADLKWESENGYMTAIGKFGFYRIFRSLKNWIILFIYMEEEPLPYYQISNSLESSLKNADNMERQLIFEKIKQKAIERDDGVGPPGNVKS
jgi:hypothetical protein